MSVGSAVRLDRPRRAAVFMEGFPVSSEQKYVLGPDGQPLIGADGKPIVGRRRPKSERRPNDPRVSVVEPTKNEAPNIREILPYLGDYHRCRRSRLTHPLG